MPFLSLNLISVVLHFSAAPFISDEQASTLNLNVSDNTALSFALPNTSLQKLDLFPSSGTKKGSYSFESLGKSPFNRGTQKEVLSRLCFVCVCVRVLVCSGLCDEPVGLHKNSISEKNCISTAKESLLTVEYEILSPIILSVTIALTSVSCLTHFGSRSLLGD